MRLSIVLVIGFVSIFSVNAQVNGVETITSKLDTIGSLSKTGKVVFTSFQFVISYSSEEHKKPKDLEQFCLSEVRYSIRQEVMKHEPDSVEINWIKSHIQPKLDSMFKVNKIQLLKLLIKNLE